ncbi:hypothetical protein [Facklamia sp. P12955]|uniref:hypothetical protein n=1 Tax=Facklamia sp. P12955 TaxID=3421946 RepID=UPI003D168D44
MELNDYKALDIIETHLRMNTPINLYSFTKNGIEKEKVADTLYRLQSMGKIYFDEYLNDPDYPTIKLVK